MQLRRTKRSGCGDVYRFLSPLTSEIERGACVRRLGHGNDKIVAIAIKPPSFSTIFFENKPHRSGCVTELKLRITHLNPIGQRVLAFLHGSLARFARVPDH